MRRLLGSLLVVVGMSGAVPASASQIVWVSHEGPGQTVNVDVGADEVLRRFATPGRPHNISHIVAYRRIERCGRRRSVGLHADRDHPIRSAAFRRARRRTPRW